ncbi:ribonuclease HII [Thiocapsa imhoffii]|uniref:Ribonuclease HII n=1 Tax=Thiocapsa imhoffii TaxID=382777 RepID=A0A9X0WGQ2_9GAMM|nr:ribonuclease HII [Thiocapsa imhoffii]MBK1644384.1 ribonuclease HII [Thiocapsa imhoffii]
MSTSVLIAGVDEAGRGPLAGPVCAAAVILDPDSPIIGLADSKRLNARRRDALDAVIREQALAWSIAWASAEEIDRINILRASLLAMQRAVSALNIAPVRVLVDGQQCPDLPCATEAVVGGDGCIPAISAASILAKVARDRCMGELDVHYPHYGFARHKGYPTRAHLAALQHHGPCAEHRRSFAPVRRLLQSSS